MEVMFDRVAGLDVGKETVAVCLRTPGPKGRRRAETRRESTSVYWKPPFYCLEEVMEVWLLNAAHMWHTDFKSSSGVPTARRLGVSDKLEQARGMVEISELGGQTKGTCGSRQRVRGRAVGIRTIRF